MCVGVSGTIFFVSIFEFFVDGKFFFFFLSTDSTHTHSLPNIMLLSVPDCVSFVFFLAMVIILYYHIYLASLGMERTKALF